AITPRKTLSTNGGEGNRGGRGRFEGHNPPGAPALAAPEERSSDRRDADKVGNRHNPPFRNYLAIRRDRATFASRPGLPASFKAGIFGARRPFRATKRLCGSPPWAERAPVAIAERDYK